ncbi:RNA methyltransferase [Isoptericola haloaureus]|uniref:RNA methyltransferase n=1 Tax=Isoptericola haloaureus TaxID=1542902 RepID=A0ABU7Z340_9MICO
MAESSNVIRRALAAGHRPRSFLMADKWLDSMADVLAAHPDVPVFVADEVVLREITGFHLHRGALAAMHRPALPDVGELLSRRGAGGGARRVAVLEDIVDHTNVRGSKPPKVGDLSSDTSRPWQRKVAKSEVDDTFELNSGVSSDQEQPRIAFPGDSLGCRGDGSASNTKRRSRIAIFENIVDHTNLGAAFRSAAAIGVDAVLVTPSCADPLYRRSIRVSMGTVFQVPWARIESWPADIDLIKEHGYIVAGMTLGEDAITLDELVAEDHPHLALVFGTEGHGLTRQADRRLDRRVTIPMMHGVDSLNVAASAAVAFYATR